MITDETLLRVFSVAGSIAVLAFIWWMLGSMLNRRRIRELVWWIRDGLPVLGEQGASGWSGGSLFRMGVFEPQPPFSTLELNIALESREVPLLWLVGHLRGQRDILVIRGRLSPKPKYQLEAVRGGSPGSGRVFKQVLGPGWRTHEDLVKGWVIADRGMGSAGLIAAAEGLLRERGGQLLRISVSKDAPNFLVNLSLARVEGLSAEGLFRGIRSIAESATR